MRRLRPASLHTRISLVLTGFAASLLLVLAGLWLHGAREAIHEEVEAANRVSLQWLTALAGEMQGVPPAELEARLLGMVRPLGRIRANALEVFAADGRRLYKSPPPTYKAGRSVPTLFAAVLEPELAPRRLAVGELQLQLTPDASRSLLDAWDDLLAMSGWALALLGLLFFATRRALDRALRPLALVMLALDRTGAGRFDTRLPVFATPELGRLSRAFNGMADRLAAAVDRNVRLETEREVGERLQARIDEERRGIARELHDELAQGITAVRALAGAIVQRTGEQLALHGHAQSIVAVTGEMQEGVRGILLRLRPPPSGSLTARLERSLLAWQLQHADVELCSRLAPGSTALGEVLEQAVVRIVQEGLTNVARHAGASRVDLAVERQGEMLHVVLLDNGRGRRTPSPQAGSGFGLSGMAERIALLGGQLLIADRPGGGFALEVRLPLRHPVEEIA